jgi:hypothetical protein
VSDCCLTHNQQPYHGENELHLHITVLNNNHSHNLILLLYRNVTCSRHDKDVDYVLNNNHSHNLILLLYGIVTRSRHDMADCCLTHNEQPYHGENELHFHITVE